MELKDILAKCDHTLLKQEARWEDIRTLCDEGVKYGVASVCIPPGHVERASSYLGDRLCVCTVIGFPNGYNTASIKAAEAEEAVRLGAGEIDMVINIGYAKEKRWSDILEEIKLVKSACDGRALKVIIETCLLSEDEKIAMCGVVSESGAEYIKTSTGFSTGGATREDVALMRKHCAEHVRIKAAGGISNLRDAEDFISLGADRLGTSRIVRLAISQGV